MLWEIISKTSAFGIFIDLALIIMSIISWMIIANKWRLFRNVKADTTRFLHNFRRTHKLDESIGQAKACKFSPLSAIFMSGQQEATELNQLNNQGGGLQESRRPLNADDFELIEMSMDKTLTYEINKLERQVIFLATTGSSAPFMGLLGTVVGIMDAFWAVGERGSASLAVVAPGIAEALLATIVGLGVAIPAVISYNWVNATLKNIHDQSSGFILEFLAHAKKENR